jgi:hypothetical protein
MSEKKSATKRNFSQVNSMVVSVDTVEDTVVTAAEDIAADIVDRQEVVPHVVEVDSLEVDTDCFEVHRHTDLARTDWEDTLLYLDWEGLADHYCKMARWFGSLVVVTCMGAYL